MKYKLICFSKILYFDYLIEIYEIVGKEASYVRYLEFLFEGFGAPMKLPPWARIASP